MLLSSIETLAARFVIAASAFVLVVASASAQDASGLPPGFKPARQPLKVLTLENELIRMKLSPRATPGPSAAPPSATNSPA